MKRLILISYSAIIFSAITARAQSCDPPPPAVFEPGHRNLKPGQVQMGAPNAERLLKQKIVPTFPTGVKVKPLTGYIKLEITIGEDGSVVVASPVCGPKALNDAAIQAVKQWTYKPFVMQGGQPKELMTYVYLPYDLRPTKTD